MESTEVSAWYEQQPRKGYSKVANANTKAKQCSKCNRSGHTQDECWGACKWCKKLNHPSDRCFNKPKEEETVEKANKAQKKKKKTKKKGAKKAEVPTLVEEDESDDDDSDSEEPSPIKPSGRVARAEVVLPKKSLAERINEMNPEQREDFKDRNEDCLYC